ncbi:MAG: hypothetical protein ABI740_10930 [Alphaproteobacteria bacterium]
MTPTAARNMSNHLASDQPERALAVARAIEAPWFRCQALAHVARYWPDENYDRFLEEAVRAGDLQDDVYSQVAVSAWPIRAYLERGNPTPARKLLAKYTRAASAIENLGGRSQALFTIFQSSKPFAPDLWQPVFWAVVSAAEPALAWRQRRNLRDAAAMVASDHPELVQEALKKMSDEKNLSLISRDLDKSDKRKVEPRPFFGLTDAERRP